MFTLCLPVHGCDTGAGGAVELSWKLRPASSLLTQKFVDCDSGLPGAGEVQEILLHWIVTPDVEGKDDIEGSQPWRCDQNHGTTGFDLVEGTAQLWVTPQCAPGMTAAPNTYTAPARVERKVIRGETVSLGAVELIVAVSNCVTAMNTTGLPCICNGSN